MTEFEKLKRAADLIRSMSEGRLRMHSGSLGTPYIQPSDDSNIGMDMVLQSDFENQRYSVTFEARIRRMGVPMGADGLRALQGEVHNAYALLMALEMQDFRPTQEDMMALREHLAQQQEQEQAAPQQTGPVMG